MIYYGEADLGQNLRSQPVAEKYVPLGHGQATFGQRWFGNLTAKLRNWAGVSVLVLILNIVSMAVVSTRFGFQNGYGTIYQGECKDAERMSTALHLLINILGTLILVGSNAFMEAFGSPSREEIDQAHRQGKWLHIGVLSLRNFWHIARWKSFVVVVLALSSMPIHLLYNAVISTTMTTNDYYWVVATEDFASGAPFVPPTPLSVYGHIADQLHQIQGNAHTYERLDPASCIKEYSNSFSPTRRNVVAVTTKKNDTDSVFRYDYAVPGTENYAVFWICSVDPGDGPSTKCNPMKDVMPHADSWTVFDYPIQYCLSEQVSSACSVRYNLRVGIAVTAFSLIKVCAMLFILFTIDNERLIVGLGDAVSSFLRFPDQKTMGMCFATRKMVAHSWYTKGQARRYEPRPWRWYRTLSVKRVALGYTLNILLLFIVLALLAWGFSVLRNKGIDTGFSGLAALGFGVANQYSLISVDDLPSTEVAAIIANFPQILLAMFTLEYQNTLKTMFVAREWNEFGFKGQMLRVSSPTGKQQGSWLLNMPLSFGSSVLILSILLHWVVSQSIFAIEIAVNSEDAAQVPSKLFSNCVFSPIAIIVTVLLVILLLVLVTVLGFRKFRIGGPPIVATCSAAISASCHAYPNPHDMVYKPLRWGCGPLYPDGVGHCSLGEDQLAQSPVPGAFYR